MAPVYEAPGVFVEELPVERPPILAASSGIAAFAGQMGAAHDGAFFEIGSYAEFAAVASIEAQSATLGVSLELYFRNGGRRAIVAACAGLPDSAALQALENSDFDLLCLPAGESDPAIPQAVHEAAAALCERRRALYLVDPPIDWSAQANPVEAARAGASALLAGNFHAALYFPRLNLRPTADNSPAKSFPPSPAVAGIIARIDEMRGVWKAPAGLDAALQGVGSLDVGLTDQEQAVLNPEAINCLRAFPAHGLVVWGARTRAGLASLASDWKYVNVRRMGLFLERSISAGLQWTEFELNGENLWAIVRNSAEQFLLSLFRQGAFAGQKPDHAYFVRCDSTTMTQDDLDNGRLTCQIGFAPLKPAEFVILSISAKTAA